LVSFPSLFLSKAIIPVTIEELPSFDFSLPASCADFPPGACAVPWDSQAAAQIAASRILWSFNMGMLST
jgi:hypothetical protein